MRAIERLKRLLRRSGESVSDPTFASYYSALVMGVRSGAPSVEEARRDFEVVRRVLDRAFVA